MKPKKQNPETITGIRWHCLACGHTWKGYVKLNPELPNSCAKCKSPYWNELPKQGIDGLHKTSNGNPCPACVTIIKRKMALAERLKAFESLIFG